MANPAGGALAAGSAAIAGERRQVTALFYDIVGSTLILQRLDPEDFALLQRRVHRAATESIRTHGGHIERLLGDGGTAYFGFPTASEDAAECAVLAALDLIVRCREAGADPQSGTALSLRVGIATGTVVISEMNDAALPGIEEIIGVTPALAARLQSEAEPDTVVVSDATYRLTRGMFAFEALGRHALKGFAEPQALWRPTARLPHPDRFSSRQSTTPLVNRVEELEALRRRWSRAASGEGQVVRLVGEAGIGKSRLVAEATQALAKAGAEIRVFQCLPRGNSRPLHPFIDTLRRGIRGDAAGGGALDPAEVRAWLDGQGAAIREEAASLIAFVSDDAASGAISGLPAEDAGRSAADAVFEVLVAWSRRKPQVLVVEDLHWADTVTLGVIAEAAERIAALPILAIVTVRPDTPVDLADDPNVLTLTISRLDGQTTPLLLDSIWDGTPPPGLAGFIHDKSDGVPLYAEELANLLKERFADAGMDARDWERSLRESSIVSLQDLLSARLSGLGPLRRFAQVAGVVGREFSAALLARLIDGQGDLGVQEALIRLVEAGILRRRGAGEGAVYRFRHVLFQEAAYDSLLKTDRRDMHRRVADLVAAGAVAAPPDEIMAWHCEQAARPLEAARYAVRAAKACALRSAMREADGLLALAEECLRRSPEGTDVEELTLDLLATQGPVKIALFGHGSPEAMATYERGVALCARQEAVDRNRWFPLYWGWWFTAPDLKTIRSRSLVLIEELDAATDPEVRLQVFHCAWASNFHAGEYGLCKDCIDKGLRLYDPERARAARVAYGGHDARVCGLGEQAQLRWLTGDPEGARASIRQALDWAERIEHFGSLCHALDNAILLGCYERDLDGVAALARRLGAIAETEGLPEVRAKSLIFGGWAAALGGALADGCARFEDGLRRQREVGSGADVPVYASLEAELLMLQGRREDAATLLRGAIAEAERAENLVWVPELCRQLALACEPEAAAALERAIALADAQGAATLAGRARTDRARLTAPSR